MKVLLRPVGQSSAMVKHWFHFLQPSFSTKCPKKKSGRENWCFLKEKRFVTPMIHAPYGSHIFVNFPTTAVLQNKPALSARARAAQRAIYNGFAMRLYSEPFQHVCHARWLRECGAGGSANHNPAFTSRFGHIQLSPKLQL